MFDEATARGGMAPPPGGGERLGAGLGRRCLGRMVPFTRPAPERSAARRGSPFLSMPRTLHPALARALDALPPEALPRFRGEGRAADAGRLCRASTAARGTGPDWLAGWLAEDVVEQAGFLALMTRSARLRFRLDAVADDGCTRLHTDAVHHRLVTTYRGPGTEWLPPRDAARLSPGAEPDEALIRRMRRGDVAVMRGRPDGAPDCDGVLHRSPRIAGTGAVRLFLAVDAL